jgi:hypothetical protein
VSYDIYLSDPQTGNPVTFEDPLDLRGGTYAVGGTAEAWLNVTYNYGGHFRRVLGENGIRSIYGKTAEETLPELRRAVAALGDDVSDDYCEATEGNAKAALLNLIALAERAPYGVWDGD